MAFRLSDPPRQRISIVSIPSLLDTNAYQRLLYEQLSAHGIDLLTGATFAVGWMARNRRAAPILHFHWQHLAYIPAIEWGEARGAWRDWFSVVRFGVRLAVARALGYRVVWTVHQLVPHESSQSDWAASVLLAYASHKLIVHDQATADSCRRLPGAARKLAILPHASYAGVYPRQRAGTDVRRGLGLTWARFVFLYFGRIRSYKNVSLLLEAFQLASCRTSRWSSPARRPTRRRSSKSNAQRKLTGASGHYCDSCPITRWQTSSPRLMPPYIPAEMEGRPVLCCCRCLWVRPSLPLGCLPTRISWVRKPPAGCSRPTTRLPFE